MSNREILEGQELIDFTAKILFGKKVEEVILIRLSGLSTVSDAYVIGNCTSEAQMRSLVTLLQRQFKKVGLRPLGVDFKNGERWAVIDMGEIMVHLFEESYREEMNLEKLWSEGEQELLNAADYVSEEVEDEDDDDDIL
jgi:ribosome-associated protein